MTSKEKFLIVPRVSVLGHSLFNEQMFMEDSAGENLTKIPAPMEHTEKRRRCRKNKVKHPLC